MAEKQLQTLKVNSLTFAKWRELEDGSLLDAEQIYQIKDPSVLCTKSEADTKIQSAISGISASGGTVTWENVQNKPNVATVEEVKRLIAALQDEAPETLDTLKEVAKALNDDPNFATTILAQIGQKATKEELALKADKTELAKKTAVTLVTWED